MPATSLASADRRQAAEEAAPRAPHLMRDRAPSGWALWAEAVRVALRTAHMPFVLWLRGGWLYRKTFRGPVPDRILFHPSDTRMRRLEDADGFMRGRFRLGGGKLEIRQGSIFDAALPGESFAAALHGFDWLRHLEAAGGDLARAFALKLTQQWVKRYARFTLPAWRPDIIAERFLNLFAHGRFFLANSDLVWRSRLFVSLRNQAQMLVRSLDEAPDGLPRLKSAAALALAGLCLGDTRHAAAGLKRLGFEIERQILPDGGHVSRSPQTLLEAYRVLAMVQQALDSAGALTNPPCAARSTAWRRCCASSAWAMARWPSFTAAVKAMRERWKRRSTATTRWGGPWATRPIRDISGSPPVARSSCSTPAHRLRARFRQKRMPGVSPSR